MFKFLLFFALVLPVWLANSNNEYVQQDYRLEHHFVKVEYFNSEYVKDLLLVNTKFNRTTRTFSASAYVLQDSHPTNVKINIETYIFLNNQYKHFAPLKFNVNVCDAFRKNWLDMKKLMTTNGNLTQCPVKKSFYYVSHFLPDESKFPPFIPEGRYRMLFLLYNENVHIATIAWYGAATKKSKL